jgi:hypothetical protein
MALKTRPKRAFVRPGAAFARDMLAPDGRRFRPEVRGFGTRLELLPKLPLRVADEASRGESGTTRNVRGSEIVYGSGDR